MNRLTFKPTSWIRTYAIFQWKHVPTTKKLIRNCHDGRPEIIVGVRLDTSRRLWSLHSMKFYAYNRAIVLRYLQEYPAGYMCVFDENFFLRCVEII